MEVEEIQVGVQYMQRLSGGRGDGSWRSEGISIQVQDKERGGVLWRRRLGIG